MTDRQRSCNDWWQEYFDKYFIIVEGIKPKEVTVCSANFVELVFDLPKGDRILDLGCGYGRMSIELAKRGYRLVGLDLSPQLPEMPKKLAKTERVEFELIKCDMREMDYRTEFDGTLSWDNSLGYFRDDENEGLEAYG